jgi:hypothetical protein
MFRYGDRVIWKYLHFTNSSTSFIRTKHGEFKGNIKHTVKHKGKQMACVKFDGNKTISKIPLYELKSEPSFS